MSFWINNLVNDFSKLKWDKLDSKFSNFNKFFLVNEGNKLFICDKEEYKMIVILKQENGMYKFLLQEYVISDYFTVLNKFLEELKMYTIYKTLEIENEENRIHSAINN